MEPALKRQEREKVADRNSIRTILKMLSWKNIVWLILFSLLLSTCLFSYVNIFVSKLLPKEEIVITVSEPGSVSNGSEVWIYMIDNKEISEEQFLAMERTGDWWFRNAEEWGYENSIILGGVETSSLTIPVTKSPSGGISIWCQAYSGAIDVEADGEIKHYDLYSEEGAYIQITPFEDSLFTVLITVFVYMILTCIVAFFLLLMIGFIQSISTDVKEPQYEYWTVVLTIFICTYIFDVVWYKKGIVNFNAFGDQPGYWDVGGQFAQPDLTKDTIIEIIKTISPIRGYGTVLPAFIAQFVGIRAHVDSYLVYFLLPSLANAFLFGYILPRIYEIIHNRKVYLWQILSACLGFLIFYKGLLVSIGGDLYGLVLYLAGALFGILIFKTGRIKYAIGSGVCFSLCLTIRTSYLIGVIVLLIVMVILVGLNFKGKIQQNGLFPFAAISARGAVKMVIAFSVSFLCICIPQIYMNEIRGHRGLFAYDQDGAYFTKTTTVLEQAADVTLRGWLTGYPYQVYDDQVHSIRQAAGYRDEKEITMAQSFDAYSKSPLDTLVAIGKRAFAMVDIKTNMNLPNVGWSAHTKYYIFSTINYIFIATALFTLLNKRLRQLLYQKMDFFFWGAVLLGPVAPLLASKIEWREVVVEYLFYIGYACAFCFAGSLYSEEKRLAIRESNYLPFMTCVVFALHAVSLTMYSNYVF
ncbi:hypothetical protein VSQ32_19655 [Lachnospiraceae bacterium KK002]